MFCTVSVSLPRFVIQNERLSLCVVREVSKARVAGEREMSCARSIGAKTKLRMTLVDIRTGKRFFIDILVNGHKREKNHPSNQDRSFLIFRGSSRSIRLQSGSSIRSEGTRTI